MKTISNTILIKWVLASFVLFLFIVFNLKLGAYPVSISDFFDWAMWRLGIGAPPDETLIVVIEKIRGPRIAAALLIGASLSCAGAAYQSIFRNPLVSPDLLAVSSGAAFGACLAIVLSATFFVIQLSAFISGIVAVSVVLLISNLVRRRDAVLALVLSGIVVGALFSAGVSSLKIIADPYQQLSLLTFWLLGSLARVQAHDITLLAPIFIIGIALLVLLRFRVDVMTLGEDEAKSLGINTGRIRFIIIVISTLLTSAAVSISGIIGWVGLVVPHMTRMIVGPNFGRMGPLSALIGATFLLIVDTVARTLFIIEIPIGILTAIIGAPIFIWLLVRGR